MYKTVTKPMFLKQESTIFENGKNFFSESHSKQ